MAKALTEAQIIAKVEEKANITKKTAHDIIMHIADIAY